MKRIVFAAVAVAFSSHSQAAELPLKRVALSTSGLAQFTHSGQVAAGAPVELSVRLDQVDDLLKSLTIFDRRAPSEPSACPARRRSPSCSAICPFGPDALNSPTALLNAMVGAEIEIEGQVTAKGRVFRVEQETAQLPNNGGQIVRHRITLLTDKGLVQAVLEELTALRFTDPQAKAQIDRALSGLALNRAKERRTLSIGFAGPGRPRGRVQLCGGRAGVEDRLPAGAAQGRRQGRRSKAQRLAGLGRHREPLGQRLARRGPDADLGQPGGAEAVALHRVLLRPSRGAGHGLVAGHAAQGRRRSDVGSRTRQALRRRSETSPWPWPRLRLPAEAGPPTATAGGAKAANPYRQDWPRTKKSRRSRARNSQRRRRRRRGRGSLDPGAVPLPRQADPGGGLDHDGALRRSRDRRPAGLALSARNQRPASPGGGAPQERLRLRGFPPG